MSSSSRVPVPRAADGTSRWPVRNWVAQHVVSSCFPRNQSLVPAGSPPAGSVPLAASTQHPPPVSCRCLGATHLLPCHEAASALTLPPPTPTRAFLRIHAQPSCPGVARPAPPRPAPTRRLKPPAPIANNLRLSRKRAYGWERPGCLQNPGLVCFAGGASVSPALPACVLLCFCFFFLISNRH